MSWWSPIAPWIPGVGIKGLLAAWREQLSFLALLPSSPQGILSIKAIPQIQNDSRKERSSTKDETQRPHVHAWKKTWFRRMRHPSQSCPNATTRLHLACLHERIIGGGRHLQALQASHSPVAEQVQLSGSFVPFRTLFAAYLSKLTGAAGSRASIAESAGAAVAPG